MPVCRMSCHHADQARLACSGSGASLFVRCGMRPRVYVTYGGAVATMIIPGWLLWSGLPPDLSGMQLLPPGQCGHRRPMVNPLSLVSVEVHWRWPLFGPGRIPLLPIIDGSNRDQT